MQGGVDIYTLDRCDRELTRNIFLLSQHQVLTQIVS